MVNGSTPQDKHTLETLWHQRLNDARLRLDFARNYMQEIKQDYAAGGFSAPTERIALNMALRAEMEALEEYNRVLAIYKDVINGEIPPDEGPPHKTAGEGE